MSISPSIRSNLSNPELGQEHFPKRFVLPAVNEDVDAGIEHQEVGGDDGHHLVTERSTVEKVLRRNNGCYSMLMCFWINLI